jgi:hypothetical protein
MSNTGKKRRPSAAKTTSRSPRRGAAKLPVRAVTPKQKVDPRAIVYSVLDPPPTQSPGEANALPLRDWGYTSIESFEVLTQLINQALLNAGVSYDNFVDPRDVADCSKVGELVTAVRKAISS